MTTVDEQPELPPIGDGPPVVPEPTQTIRVDLERLFAEVIEAKRRHAAALSAYQATEAIVSASEATLNQAYQDMTAAEARLDNAIDREARR